MASNYCNFESAAAKAAAGKDILLCIFDATGEKLLAISGQQGLTVTRTAEALEVTSKDAAGGWKSKIAGTKEWSIENSGIYTCLLYTSVGRFLVHVYHRRHDIFFPYPPD